MILVDSNVLIDLSTNDPVWSNWSATALQAAMEADVLALNPIIYAEVSVRFGSVDDLEDALELFAFQRLALPYESAFLAGKAFAQYRRRGGARTSPLPDFFIGAHAAVERLTLLTRDPRRYTRYFPGVKLIAPEPG